MKNVIVFKNGQVLVLKVDTFHYPSSNDFSLAKVNGANICFFKNDTIFINTDDMEENESIKMVKDIAESLVSDGGTITYLDPTINKKVLNKRLTKEKDFFNY